MGGDCHRQHRALYDEVTVLSRQPQRIRALRSRELLRLQRLPHPGVDPVGIGRECVPQHGHVLFQRRFNKLHVRETCAGDGDGERLPNIITNVATTDAAVPDTAMTTPIHEGLARRGLLPDEHLVDSGYPSADLLVESADRYGVRLLTPMLADVSPQARAGTGFDAAAFGIDFDSRQATCPQGQVSTSWSPAQQRGTDTIVVKFATDTCQPCPMREQCTTAKRSGRQLTIRPRHIHHC